MGISLVTVILSYGTLDLYKMVEAQSGLWGIIKSPMMFVAAVIFFVSGMAETKEHLLIGQSESELVAGYFTEYSGMKFLLFWLAEFCEIALVSLVMSVIFFGVEPTPIFTNRSTAWLFWYIASISLAYCDFRSRSFIC